MQFEWDENNWPKCGKHGVNQVDIEAVLASDPDVHDDVKHSGAEKRWIAVGRVSTGQHIFIVFCFRNGAVRPISARYMHQSEVEEYQSGTSKKERKRSVANNENKKEQSD